MKCQTGWSIAGIKIARKISINSDMQKIHPYGRKWRETKEPLNKSERWEWKSWLKTQHWKKQRSQYPVLSLHGKLMGKTMETVKDSSFLGSKITADGGCSHEIKRCFLLGSKAVTNLDSILKSRTITLMTKAHKVKTMVLLVVMYRCDSWALKKVEC